jgi:filamentous hemagglutinin
MNKFCYRIIFNHARGMLMAVQETARGAGKGVRRSRARTTVCAGGPVLPALCGIAKTLLGAFGIAGIMLWLAGGAAAQIVADPRAPGGQRPTVLTSANGVAQVNVQTPSAAGVSRNTYSQFDVSKGGVILNNSRSDVRTQLGGWVQGNPWLARGGARVILNEVNSSHPSQLRGFVEVAGPRAELVVANPAGISVDGGGFINVSRATLTTGTPVLSNGNLEGFTVHGGRIEIGGAGLDASQTDYTALIARSLAVNAGIWAQQLNVTTGLNQVSAAGGTAADIVSGTEDDGTPAPAGLYSIDVSQLGGMYANKIVLVGTEAGIGVRNAGAIGAAAGEAIVTSAGRLENSGSLAATGQLTLAGAGLANSGSISSAGAVSVDSTSSVANTGKLFAATTLEISSPSAVRNDGTISAREGLALRSVSLDNTGILISGGAATLALQGQVSNTGGTIEAPRLDIGSATGGISNRGGKIIQSGGAGLDIAALGLVNSNGGTIGAPLAAAIADGGTGPATSPGASLASASLGSSASSPAAGTAPVNAPAVPKGFLRAALAIDNDAGAILAGGTLGLLLSQLDNSGGQLSVDTLSVAGPDFSNRLGKLTVARDFSAHTISFSNQGGSILVGQGFDGQAVHFNNSGGLLQAQRLAVSAANALDNSGGVMRQTGTQTLTMSAGGAFSNDGGTIETAGALALAIGALNGGGTLNVGGDLQFKSGAASARDANWLIGGDAILRADAFDNSGAISAGKNLELSAARLTNRGSISAAFDAAIQTSGALDNSNGYIQAGNNLQVGSGGALSNHGGVLEALAADATLTVEAQAIDALAGRIVNAGTGETRVASAGAFTSSSLVSGRGALFVGAQTLANLAGGVIASDGPLALGVRQQLDNAGGTISSIGTLLFSQATATLNNTNDGRIVSFGDASLLAAAIHNDGGQISTGAGKGGTLTIHTGSGGLSNRTGAILGDSAVAIEAAGAIDNSAGHIQATDSLVIGTAAALNNTNGDIGAIGAASTFGLAAASVDNSGGRLVNVGGGQTSITSAAFANTGTVAANGQLLIAAGTLHNGAAGSIASSQELNLKAAGRLDNLGGAISSGGALSIDVASAAVRNSGKIIANGRVAISAASLANDGGEISNVKDSGADVIVDATNLSNRGGTILAARDAMFAIAGALDNDQGTVQANRAADLAAGGLLSNIGGSIEVTAGAGATGMLTLHAHAIDSDGRIVNAGSGATTVASQNGILNGGLIAGNGTLVVTAKTLENRETGALVSGSGLELGVTQQLENLGSISSAGLLNFLQAGAGFVNRGSVVAGGETSIAAASIDNDAGRIATARGSNAAITLHGLKLSNRSGLVAADGKAHLQTSGAIDNTDGAMQAGRELLLSAGGTLNNDGGNIEANRSSNAAGAMEVRAAALENGSGRIVNLGSGDTAIVSLGSLTSSGLLAANGKLDLLAAALQNRSGGAISAVSELDLGVTQHLDNGGAIGSGGTLNFTQAGASFCNSGQIVSGGAATVLAASIDNDRGRISTSRDSAAGIELSGGSMSNRGGTVLADGRAAFAVGDALDNTGGVLQAGKSLQLDAGGALANSGGTIEADGAAATLGVHAAAIDSTAGRIVNAGTGDTTVSSAGAFVNSGLLAANGRLTLSGQVLDNGAGGTISSVRELELALHHQLSNQGAISSGGTLNFAQGGAGMVNAGQIVAAAQLSIAVASVNNDGGQIATADHSGAGIDLQAASLSNRGGAVLADGSATFAVGGAVDNAGGTLQTNGGIALAAAGALNNSSGVIEASGAGGMASTLEVHAQAVDSIGGRIVNAGSGATTVSSQTRIASSGTLAGNGAVRISAQTLHNATGGTVSSSQNLELALYQQLDNAGLISSGGTLTFRQAASTVRNSGQLVSNGQAIMLAASIDNNGGHIATTSNSAAGIVLASQILTNRGGKILAAGNGQFTVNGNIDNSWGLLQAAGDVGLSTAGTLVNDGGVIEAVGATSAMQVQAQSVSNLGGRITNIGSSDTTILSQAGLLNSGAIAANGKLDLLAQALDNRAEGSIASAGALQLGVSQRLDNAGAINSGGSFEFRQTGATLKNGGQIVSDGNAVIAVAQIHNDGGRIGTSTGSGADLSLTSQVLSNAGGHITGDRDVTVVTQQLQSAGELFAGRDLALSFTGDYANTGGSQIHSNRDLGLTLTGQLTNTATLEAVRNLALTAGQIDNRVGATIRGEGVALNAGGGVTNAGEISGDEALTISTSGVSNTNSIIGGALTVQAQTVNNTGPLALLGATDAMSLWVGGTLNNTAGAMIYSGGDIAIAAGPPAYGQPAGRTDLVNNVGSTIEAAGALDVAVGTLNNTTENVRTIEVTTVDETTIMKPPAWWTPSTERGGANDDYYSELSSHYHAYEVYFVNPADILERSAVVTPDGYTVYRAVIRTHANDSVFFSGWSGAYGAYGKRERLQNTAGTRVLYYYEYQENHANPDQGGAAYGAWQNMGGVKYWADAGSAAPVFSSQYGSCSVNCVRMVTTPGYDPVNTVLRDRLFAFPGKRLTDGFEISKTAHHTATEDRLAAGAGATAQFLSGGNMHISFSQALNNNFSEIRAAGTLWADGGASGVATNTGLTLYRKHSFDGVIKTVDGTNVAYTMPDISEVIGSVGGVISGGSGVLITGKSFSNVDVAAGTAGDIRASVHVLGSGVANIAILGAAVSAGSTGSAAHASGIASGGMINNSISNSTAVAAGFASGATFATGATVNGAFVNTDTGGKAGFNRIIGTMPAGGAALGGASAVRQTRGIDAASAGRNGAPATIKVASSGLFSLNPDAGGSYLLETRAQFANQREWISSDFLLDALNLDPSTVQKRLGDAFYEQRLVREQLADLTGRSVAGGEASDAKYQELLSSGASYARQWNLRPGIALSAEQVSHLTSDIAWLESQTVSLPDGSTQQVLVPKVYLAHVPKDAVQPGGALVTGSGVTIATADIVNRGGVIDGGSGRTVLVAQNDILNQGGVMKGGDIALQAGRDIRNESLSVQQNYATVLTKGSYTSQSNVATITASGALSASAERDVTDIAGRTNAASATITAGRDIAFEALRTDSDFHIQVGQHSANSSSVGHQVGHISTTDNLAMAAGQDLKLNGTQVAIGTGGSGDGVLIAGRDLAVGAMVNEAKSGGHNNPSAKYYATERYENQTVVGASVLAAGDLMLKAGVAQPGSLAVTGSALGSGGALVLAASGDINIGAASESHVLDTAQSSWSKGFLKKSSSKQADYSASTVAVRSSLSGGAVTLQSGNDINIGASSVTAQDALTLLAGRDLNITTVEQSAFERHSLEQKKSGFSFSLSSFGYSKAQQNRNGSEASTTQVGSMLSGASVTALAGRDLQVQGSTVVADSDVVLAAGRDISIVSAQNTSSSTSASSSKKSGMIGSLFQPAIGTVKSSQDGTATSVTQLGSQVASLGGDVTIRAGEQYTQTSSQVLAPGGDIGIAAKDVLINGAFDSGSYAERSKYSKVAIGASVTMPLLSAVQGMASVASAVKDTGNGRMQALGVLTAGLQAKEALAGAQALANGGLAAGGIKIGISLGSSKSESSSVQSYRTAVGSTVAAGGNLSIVATGAGKNSNLTVIGSDIAAGDNVILLADNTVNLLAAADTASQHSDSKSSGANIGVGIALGGAQNGLTLELGASKGRGKTDGDDVTYANTHVHAGKTVLLQSGGDTNLKGGVLAGDTVLASIGGDLNIESLQDRNTYDSKQTSAGFGLSLCIPPACYGASTGTLSASRAKVEGDFLSVTEQSGIKSGDGGFQLAVAGNTDLIGGVIASSQAAIDQTKNSLSTGSLTFSALENRDEYQASGFALSAPVSGKMGEQSTASTDAQRQAASNPDSSKPGASAGAGSASGSRSSVTLSGISAGTLTITDAAKQAQTGLDIEAALAGISRTVTTENSTELAGALTQAWNGEKLMKEVQAQVANTQAFSAQAPRAIAEYADRRAAALDAQLATESDSDKRAALSAELEKWGESGSYRVTLHTVSGALSGGVGGAIGAGVISRASTMLDDFQIKTELALQAQGISAEAAAAIAQGIMQATSLGIGGALGGAAGAGTSLSTDTNNRQLHTEERNTAGKLAAISGGIYTQAQIEAAMRVSSNVALGENATNGMVVPLTASTTTNDLYDGTGMVLSRDGAGKAYLVQQINWSVDPALAAYIQSYTGGSQSPYAWDSAVLGNVGPSRPVEASNPFIPNLHGCVAAECAAYVLPNVPNLTRDTRLLGGAQGAGGLTQIAGGAAMISFGLGTCVPSFGAGCVVAAIGGFQAIAGLDNLYTGGQTAIYGVPYRTLGGALLQKTGLSPGGAELLYGGFQLGSGWAGVRVFPSLSREYASSNDVWHATVTPDAAQGILEGIDPFYFSPKSRFGAAFYVAEQPGTTIAELAYHGVDATHGIRFELNRKVMNILDLTNAKTANAWGYGGGSVSPAIQNIGILAKEKGYNVIRFYSERTLSGGINNAVLSDYGEILRPVMISPVKR